MSIFPLLLEVLLLLMLLLLECIHSLLAVALLPYSICFVTVYACHLYRHNWHFGEDLKEVMWETGIWVVCVTKKVSGRVRMTTRKGRDKKWDTGEECDRDRWCLGERREACIDACKAAVVVKVVVNHIIWQYQVKVLLQIVIITEF